MISSTKLNVIFIIVILQHYVLVNISDRMNLSKESRTKSWKAMRQ